MLKQIQNVPGQQLLALNTPAGATTEETLNQFKSLDYLFATDLKNLFQVIEQTTEDCHPEQRLEKIASLARVGRKMIDEDLFFSMEAFFEQLSIHSETPKVELTKHII